MRRESISFINDPDLARFIDSACDRFASEFNSQSQPRIEEYLQGCPEAAAPVLFRELLALEFEYLQRQAQLPSVDDYILRFPDATQTVKELYQEVTKPASAENSTQAPVTHGTDSTLRFELGHPAPSAERESTGAESLPPSYTVIRPLGQGGMGEVYLARQDSADRLVAIKIIRPDRVTGGKFDSQVVARFRREIKAAARLEHDHVVSVYDVGEWQGQPFYSMRYVPGETLRQRLNQGPLDGRVAAAMIRDVASAIAAAHQAGILHRDLKPHNILIEQDTNRPLVADFGLAKVMGGSEEMTVEGAVFGSPPYMAPEQALNAAQANEASDVYGIGATLYHALTGRPPFQAASVPETLHQVVHSEPLSVRKLNPAVAVDLETICMKCLSKEPQRRYPSALALADELKCFLEDRPISARPTGSVEHAWRWVRRNRRLASLLAALLISILAGSLGIFIQWRNSERNLVQAQRNFDMARNRLHLGQEVMRELLVNVSKEELRDVPQIEPVRQELLQKALGYYDKFIEEAQGDPVLKREQAIAQTSLGEINLWLGNFSQAATELVDAKQQVLQLLEGQNSQADELELRSALADIHSHLGVVAFRAGNLDAAEREFLDLQHWASQLPGSETEPNLAPVIASDGLASVYRERGDLQRAREAFQQSLNYLKTLPAVDQQRPAVLQLQTGSNYNLGLVLRELGLLDESEQASQNALTAVMQWAELAPESVVQQQLHAHVLQGIGWLRNAQGRPSDALASLLEAAALEQELSEQHPQVPRYRLEFARLQSSIAFTQELLGDTEGNAAALDKASSHLHALLAEEPGVPEYAGLLGEIQVSRGWALQASDAAKSAEAYTQAIQLLQQGLESAADNQHLLTMLGQAYHGQGILYNIQLHDDLASRKSYEQAYSIRKKLIERVASATLLDAFAYTCANLSFVLQDLGEKDSAIQYAGEACRSRQQIFEQSPSANNQFQWATTEYAAAHLMFACKAPDLARSHLDNSLKSAEAVYRQHPQSAAVRNSFSKWIETWCYDSLFNARTDKETAMQRVADILDALAADLADTLPLAADPAIVRLRVLRAYALSRFQAEHELADQELEMASPYADSELQTLLAIAKLEITARRGDPAAAIKLLSQHQTDSPWYELPRARIYLLAAQACAQDANLSEPERSQACEQYQQQAVECMQKLSATDSQLAERILEWDDEMAEISEILHQLAMAPIET